MTTGHLSCYRTGQLTSSRLASVKGFRQSFGLMVNYLYDPEEIENNVKTAGNDGKIKASASVRRLARSSF